VRVDDALAQLLRLEELIDLEITKADDCHRK